MLAHVASLRVATVLGALTVSEFARTLEVSRVALSRVINGRAAVSADMALRLADALGGSPESWLRLQASYDLCLGPKAASSHRAPASMPFAIVAQVRVVGVPRANDEAIFA